MDSRTPKKDGEGEVEYSDLNEREAGEEVAGANPGEGALSALEAARKEAETAQKEMLYLRADFDNYRKRIIKEQDQAIKFANKQFITELLNVVDYFERGIEHAKNLKNKGDAEVSNFVNGIEMTHRELIQLLGRSGVEFVGKVGEKFDPEKHEAISEKETSPEGAGTVLEVHQKGSLLHGKLIKPARVVVGK